jgi:hypothetical protein
MMKYLQQLRIWNFLIRAIIVHVIPCGDRVIHLLACCVAIVMGDP